MTRAAFYARVSTADQVEGTSLDTQKAWCLGQIAARGWDLAGEFVDAGLSGADANRPAWTRLLRAARDGEFQAVFVYDLDRFTRDMLHGLQAIRELQHLGVTLHDAKDPTANAASVDSQLMTGFRLLIAEEERRKIKERTVRGQRAKLERGEWAGGKPSYGWRLEGIRTRAAHPVPDEGERRTLRLVYGWLVRDGLSVGQICDRLNAAGVASRNGGRWSHTVLRRMLVNPTLHTGWFMWGEPKGGSTDKRSHKTKVDRQGVPVNGEPRKVFLPDPPFTAAEARAVTRALARHPRAHSVARPSVTRLLTGRLVGGCGKHYTGTSINGKDYDVYRCTGNRHRGVERAEDRCGCNQVHAQKLEARVWSQVVELLSNPTRLEAMARQWLNLSESGDPDLDRAEVEGVRARTAKLERALAQAEDELFLADDDAKDRHRERVARFSGELADLRRRREAFEALQVNQEERRGQLVALADLVAHAADRLETMSDLERREVLELLRVRVVMGDIRGSEPRALTVAGQIDPRLFDDGSQEDRGTHSGGTDGPPTASTPDNRGHGRDRVLGSGCSFFSPTERSGDVREARPSRGGRPRAHLHGRRRGPERRGKRRWRERTGHDVPFGRRIDRVSGTTHRAWRCGHSDGAAQGDPWTDRLVIAPWRTRRR